MRDLTVQHKEILEIINANMQKMIKENNDLTIQVIEQTVNGKIDKANKLSQEAVDVAKAAAQTAYHNSQETVRINREVDKSLTELKNLIIPLVEVYTDGNASLKVAKWLIRGIMIVGGLWILTRTIIKGW